MIIINSKAAAVRLNKVRHVINTSGVLPILQSILVTVSKQKIKFTVTDLEQYASIEMDAESKSEKMFCVDFNYFFNTVNNCEEQPITLSYDGDTLRVRGCNFTVNIATENSDHFPKEPTSPDARVKMFFVKEKSKTDVFKQLSNSLPFVSTDDLRPAMTGVFLHKNKSGKVSLVSTDAHRLYFKELPYLESDMPLKMIIPSKVIRTALLLFSKSNAVYIDQMGQYIIFSDGYGIQFYARLIDAKFPDYEIVLSEAKQRLKHSVAAFTKQMMAMIKFSKAYTNKSTHQIAFTVTDVTLSTKAADVDFGIESCYTIPVYQAKVESDLKIAFNSNFLIQIINIFKDEYVTIRFGNSTHAAIINDSVLIMPLMLND